MTDFRQNLLNRAFRIVPGVEFNRARRELIEQSEIVPVIYEIILPETGSWESFRDVTFPLLVRCAKAQGVDPENPKLLIAAVFFKDNCYLIQGIELINFLREMEGLNTQALHFRVLRWLEETQPVASFS